jgi:predicted secreted protein
VWQLRSPNSLSNEERLKFNYLFLLLNLAVAALLGNEYTPSHKHTKGSARLLGGGGTHTFTFKAEKKGIFIVSDSVGFLGNYNYEFVYVRPWETNKLSNAVPEVYSVTVE